MLLNGYEAAEEKVWNFFYLFTKYVLTKMEAAETLNLMQALNFDERSN